MNQQVKKQWVEALRSGMYRQGKGTLRMRTPANDKFCCLGVLCDLYVQANPDDQHNRWPNRSYYRPGERIAFCYETWSDQAETWVDFIECSGLPPAVREWAGLDIEDPLVNDGGALEPLSVLNDSDTGWDFNSIASLIEEQL